MKVKTVILLFQILPISAYVVSYESAEENVAVRGKATQSEVYFGEKWKGHSLADNAIDGNRDSDARHGSCSLSSKNVKPWWRVDLLKVYVINSVTITNRGDCCAERISGAQIHIGETLVNNGIDNPICAVVGAMGAGETKTFNCPQSMTGRYVTIYIPRVDHLQLCEVEVNACRACMNE